MSEEQPADMLARLGSVGFLWAQEFNKTAVRLGYSEMDEGWLIGWFANAIEHSCNPLRNECERLREENARLREALQPFAEMLKGNYSHQSDDMPIKAGANQYDLVFVFTLGDLRAAAAAIREGGEDGI